MSISLGVVNDVVARQAATARGHAFTVRDRVFGCIIKCPAQENGKRQKHDKTRDVMFSRTHRGEGKTVRLTLAEQRGPTPPRFSCADKVRPCIFVLPIQLLVNKTARNEEHAPAQELVDTCRSRIQRQPFQRVGRACRQGADAVIRPTAVCRKITTRNLSCHAIG
jgi:hypothetical protein